MSKLKTPATFETTFGMHENGADIRDIQAMLGHVRLETSQIYTKVSIQHLKAIHTATHPGKLAKEGMHPMDTDSLGSGI